jgi:uncharacterized membrane protein
VTRRSWIQLAVLVALALSLVANFFLVGATLSGAGGALGSRLMTNDVGSAYPEDVRTEFRRIMRENRSRTFGALRDLRKARENLAAATKASPLDERQVVAAMQDVRDATTALQTLVQENLLVALKRVRKNEG